MQQPNRHQRPGQVQLTAIEPDRRGTCPTDRFILKFYSADPAASVEFFTRAFGWNFQQWDDNPYWPAFTGPDGPGIDGAVAPAPEDRGPHTLNTIAVDNLEEAIAAAEQAGGGAVTEIIDITGVGRWIQIREPGGNIFGLMQGCHADQPGGENPDEGD